MSKVAKKVVINGEELLFSGGGYSNGGTQIPSGIIVIWSGSSDNIPDGWFLCDGTNGTPNLKDRFVLSFGENHMIGETGGSEEVTLDANNLPPHTHYVHVDAGTYSSSAMVRGAVNFKKAGSLGMASATNTTENNPHENMPPYYTLAYIMKG